MINKLLFIMFPGNMVTKKGWDTTGKSKKNNFIKEINY